MSFEIDLRARLANDPTVSGLVGTRIYWKIRPQGTDLPAIILSMVSGQRDQVMSGPMGTQGNRVQFDCMTSSKSAAIALRNSVLALIEAKASHGATTFQGGFVSLYRDTAEDTVDGVVHNEMIDATIWFN